MVSTSTYEYLFEIGWGKANQIVIGLQFNF